MRSENAQTRAILHGRRYYKNSRDDQEFATVDHAHVNVPGTEFASSCARAIWSVGRVCSYTHGDFFVGKSVVVQSVVLSVKSLNIRMHNQRFKNISDNQRCFLLRTCPNTPCPHAPGGQHRWHCRGTCPTDRRLRKRLAVRRRTLLTTALLLKSPASNRFSTAELVPDVTCSHPMVQRMKRTGHAQFCF